MDRPFYWGDERFDQCPVLFLIDHPDLLEVFRLFRECCGGVISDAGVKFLPNRGSVGDQPHHIMQAFAVIQTKLHELMESEKDDAEKG